MGEEPGAACRISYRFEQRDLVAVIRALGHRPLASRLVLVVSWFAAIAIFVFIVDGSSPERFLVRLDALLARHGSWWLYAILVIVPVYILASHHLWALMWGPFYRTTAVGHQNVEVIIQDGGIESSAGDIRSEIGWGAIKKVIETRSYLFLAISKREALTVPRRAFATDDDYQAARSLILRQIGPEVPVVAL